VLSGELWLTRVPRLELGPELSSELAPELKSELGSEFGPELRWELGLKIGLELWLGLGLRVSLVHSASGLPLFLQLVVADSAPHRYQFAFAA